MRGTSLVTFGLMAVALVLGPNPLSAELFPVQGGDQDQVAKPDRAERLEAIARDLLSDGDIGTWEQAAELLEKSGRLRTVASLERIEDLRMAACLFTWTGAKEHARDLFQDAADEAWQRGDLALAAHTYLDAAVLSAELKMGRHAIQATRMADQLAASPEMARADREAVTYRLEHLGLPMHLGEIM